MAALPSHKLKATYLLNISRLCAWGEARRFTQEQPLQIGVLGDDALLIELRLRMDSDEERDLPFVVRAITAREDEAGCELLYVGVASVARRDALLRASAGRPVLTVGANREFLAAGGILAMYEGVGRLLIGVRSGGAEEAGLVLSSRLLHLAQKE
jgi:hypothetical protein